MKHLKKYEKYELDLDGEIAEEYAKLIISTYLDKKDEESLESVYAEIVKGDEIQESEEYIIKNTLQDYLYKLFQMAQNIKPVTQIEAKKYNL